jgi:AraC-like DNA-binding protein
MLYLPAIFLSFFLAFILFTKKNKSVADKILVAWLGVIGIHLLAFYLFFTGSYINYPFIIAVSFPLPLAHGPFLFLYTYNQTSGKVFNKTQLIHLLPVLLSLALFSGFFFLSPEQQLAVIKNKGAGYEKQMLVNLVAIYISGIVYIAASVKQLAGYHKRLVNEFSNTEKINFNWLLYLIIWMAVIWMIVLFVHKDEWLFGVVAVFVAWLGYFGIKQVQVFSQHNKNDEPATPPSNVMTILPAGEYPARKYLRSTLGEKEASDIHRRLLDLIETTQPYKDPDLTLNGLAESLNVHPNTLSQVINSKEHKNFYDLINEKRVQEFMRVSASALSQQYTLLSLAFDCGFNSKASFNRNFKKYTGVTPSDYLRQQPQAV